MLMRRNSSNTGTWPRPSSVTVTLLPFIIGANGAYPMTNDHTLKEIGISETFARKLKIFAVNEVLNNSAAIYYHHLDRPPSPDDSPSSTLNNRRPPTGSAQNSSPVSHP